MNRTISAMKKQIFGVSYVSVWVLIWGTGASLIDAPLLASDAYIKGSIGQASVFTIIGILSTIIAISLFPKVQKIDFIRALIETKNN